jgi:hypothetical protein
LPNSIAAERVVNSGARCFTSPRATDRLRGTVAAYFTALLPSAAANGAFSEMKCDGVLVLLSYAHLSLSKASKDSHEIQVKG